MFFARPESQQTFDYIVVGGGTAGCVLANRLSEDPSTKVLLLEAGGKDNYIWIHVPVGYLYCMGNPRTDWRYKIDADAGLNGRVIDYPRGRVLGGCSSINGMIYMRGQSSDYDGWRDTGNIGWAWNDVLPYFKKSEDYFAGATDMHGAGGEWRVEEQRLKWDILDSYRDAAESLGIAKINDFNLGDNAGSAYFQVNQRGGWRWNTAKGFLRPAKERSNLSVVTNAQVERILFDGRRATGVAANVHGETNFFTASGEVILSAGAIGSPQLLELSGIGRPEVLRTNGIEVLHSVPDVGENLQDHLQLRVVFRVSHGDTLNTRVNSLAGKLQVGLEYILKRTGPMAMAPSQLGIFAKSDPSIENADLEFHVQPLSLERFGQPLHSFPAFTASVVPIKPESRGSVHIGSRDPIAHPSIRPNYLSTAGDRLVAARAIRLARKIAEQSPMSKYSPTEIKPGVHFQSDENLAKAAGDIGTTIFHPVGTCRMGIDEKAVVDPQLRVRGIENLRVADASVMPKITSGNTNSPTLMIAEKAADMIKRGSSN